MTKMGKEREIWQDKWRERYKKTDAEIDMAKHRYDKTIARERYDKTEREIMTSHWYDKTVGESERYDKIDGEKYNDR